MDVTRRFATACGLLASLFVFAACSQKSSDSVYNANSASAACVGQAYENRFIVEWEDGHYSVHESTDIDTFKKEFVEPNIKNIKLVENDRRFKAFSDVHESAVTSSNNSWGQDLVHAPALWNQGIIGTGVTVGVVDAYVDVTHNQIRPRIALNSADIYGNKIDDDGNGYVDDTYGAVFLSAPDTQTTLNRHGTHVSGIIAADQSAGSVKGMAPGAKIVPGQFIANDGSGSISDAIRALQYVASRGAKVVNASWGGTTCSVGLRNQFEAMAAQGIMVIVAAGNDGTDIDMYPDWPAAFDFGNQLTVAAGDAADYMTIWSNRGFKMVHLGAPGDNILSTVPGNSTSIMSGTSMAAPFVTGAAALLFSAKPNATVAQVRQALIESVDVTPGHEYKVSTRGRMNVERALARLQQLVP